MIFTPTLQPARLLRRYKRFLADMEMPDGSVLTVHCPNTGSMKNCMTEGGQCWLLHSDNPKRKYAYTWQLSTTPTGDVACVNTQVANKVVAEALAGGLIEELSSYAAVRPEVKYGEGSRIDFLLQGDGLPDCYVEVKSVTLLDTLPGRDAQGYFPDSVSTRGQKHLTELMRVKKEGARAVLLFCALHTGIKSVSAAAHIDKRYAQLLEQAQREGVEVIAYGADLNEGEIKLKRPLPII